LHACQTNKCRDFVSIICTPTCSWTANVTAAGHDTGHANASPPNPGHHRRDMRRRKACGFSAVSPPGNMATLRFFFSFPFFTYTAPLSDGEHQPGTTSLSTGSVAREKRLGGLDAVTIRLRFVMLANPPPPPSRHQRRQSHGRTEHQLFRDQWADHERVTIRGLENRDPPRCQIIRAKRKPSSSQAATFPFL
jgi:hypothetical protein